MKFAKKHVRTGLPKFGDKVESFYTDIIVTKHFSFQREFGICEFIY